MPSDRSPAVVLFAPALDVGAPTSANAAAVEPPAGAASVTGPPSDRSAGSAPARPVDALADAGGGRVARRARVPLPWEARLMTALGLLPADADPAAARAAVPLARLLGPDDLSAPTADHLAVADFVSLTPSRDEATLAPAESLGLTAAESDALADAANALLAEDDIAFVRGASGRWYLRGMDTAGLETAPAHFLARREIGSQLPASSDAAPWRQLMAELEMLWHAHPVNEARQARGAPPVNGVWFWGSAALPAPIERGDGTAPALLADDPLARALGGLGGATVLPPGTALEEALAVRAGNPVLVVDLGPYAAWLRNDADALDEARSASLSRLVRPAAAAVVSGRAASFTLVGDASEADVEAPAASGPLARLIGWWRTR